MFAAGNQLENIVDTEFCLEAETCQRIHICPPGHGQHPPDTGKIQVPVCMFRYGIAIETFQALHACQAGVFPVTVSQHDLVIDVLQTPCDGPRDVTGTDDQKSGRWRFPDTKQLVRGYVDALLRAGQGQKALAILDEYSRIYIKDAALYRLEAEAYRQIGDTVNSRMALAEHYYQNGELDAAIHQLQLAGNEPGGDFYANSRLDARLKELENERNALNRR